MKRLTITLCFSFIVLSFASAQNHPDWENPRVFERNQVRPHATLMPFDDLDGALSNERKSSSFHQTLNGAWKFHWAENPEVAPEGFFKKDYLRGDWRDIQVPSNWQMEGYGYPLFRNIGLPFEMGPPGVPDDFNPVGSYFRTFTLPDEWNGSRIFLHFEGVHSASYVWINGKEVGYNQGGMEPAEYDITSYLKAGENSIAVQVLRYSDGVYMEDQDTWRLSGIYRDVYLMATPKVHIRDFFIVTDLDADYRDAMLKLESELMNYGRREVKDYSVRVKLFDPDKRPVRGFAGKLEVEYLTGKSALIIRDSILVKDPAKWSAEYPNLYTLILELMDENGEVLEIISSRVGFREVEVKDQAILVNGVPIKFNGVNSHMMHPETGHTMDVETMKKDLHLMKQFNINCVRTSHYPPNVEYLDLADELGIYVVDETGDEAHAYTQISHLPEWRDQYLDRMKKMVYRDRNHPSVVLWSAGNESGPGDNICALIEAGKVLDPSRPAWLYGGNRDRDPKTNPIRCEDIVGPRYLQPFIVEQRFAKSDDPRPSFMDEYIAATGNSLGGLDEYWELIRKYPRLTGGAIWDWISPGITQPVVVTRDDSPEAIKSVFMNKAHLVKGEQGQALYLSGHDDWLEISRDPGLDISGSALSISFHIRPEAYNGNAYFLTKGNYQYGIVQSDEEHLEFYIYTGEKVSLRGRLPDDWVHNWHHVAGIYDGKKLELYVDGRIIGTKACQGDIVNGPYRVNIGKSTEIRDSHKGYLCHATIDEIRIFDKVISKQDLLTESEDLKSHSRLWLDFETSQKTGDFYSIGIPGRTYGLIWPDRSVQPELWQLKKSPQPVEFIAIDLENGRIEVINHHHFRDLRELDMEWVLTANEAVLEKGKLELELKPGEAEIISIPFKTPLPDPGKVYHLLISCSLKGEQVWADAGHEVAWEQFKLPFYRKATGNPGSAAVEMEENGEILSISGNDFTYIFGKKTGVLQSININGDELIQKGPAFNVWRAPLANDLDSWSTRHVDIGQIRESMGLEVANGWLSIGLDRLVHDVESFESELTDGKAEIRVETSVHAINYTTGFKVYYHYTISGNGEIKVSTRVTPHGNMTRWLPKLGLQMELAEDYRNIEWYGRGPFETYPDRKTGAKVGRYTTTVDKDFVPYIIPQDYGNKTDVYWFSITNERGTGLYVTGDEVFSASAQKYSTDNLTRAYYPFQLKEEKGVTLNIDHRVSGVGGTANSVLNKYQVLPKRTSFTFYLRPLI